MGHDECLTAISLLPAFLKLENQARRTKLSLSYVVLHCKENIKIWKLYETSHVIIAFKKQYCKDYRGITQKMSK